MESTILRFGIPYGPRARPAAVIPSFVRQRSRRRAAVDRGRAASNRARFVYVEDLADGVVAALAPAAAGRTYNLAGSETVTIRGLAELVQAEVAPVDIVHTEGRAGDLQGATIRSDRAERELGWRATTPLGEGVRRYAEWLETDRATDAAPGRAGALSHRAAGARSLAGRFATAALEPSRIGFVSLIAVVSSLLPALVSTRRVGDAAGVTLLVVMLMVPLWAVTVTEWPLPLRRVQAAIALLIGLARRLSRRDAHA